jgi:hypothetical protein
MNTLPAKPSRPLTTYELNLNYEQLLDLSVRVAKSNMFGFKTPEQALTVMLMSMAQGRQPVLGLMEYHPMDKGKPTLRSDAVLARFMEAGGKVEWKERNKTKAVGVFTHPLGGSNEIVWTMERAKTAEIGSGHMWRKWPENMLVARCITDGVRLTWPSCMCGVNSVEEQDSDPDNDAKAPTTIITVTSPSPQPPVTANQNGEVVFIDPAASVPARPFKPDVLKMMRRQRPKDTNEELGRWFLRLSHGVKMDDCPTMELLAILKRIERNEDDPVEPNEDEVDMSAHTDDDIDQVEAEPAPPEPQAAPQPKAEPGLFPPTQPPKRF